jgi:cytochrome c oxidase subunit II
MFSEAFNFATYIDNTFLFLIGIALFLIIGITVTMIFFAILYNKKRHPKAIQIKDNIVIEISWTIVPLILVSLLFYFGYEVFMPKRDIPRDAIQIKVTAKISNWTFEYDNGKLSNDTLVIPLNKPVSLNLLSPDVAHSFYIPALKVKEEIVPGVPSNIWFKAERPGIYEIISVDYRDFRYSYLKGFIKIITEKEYNNWLTVLKASAQDLEQNGLIIIRKNACLACHSIDGSKIVGPSFKGLYNSENIVITNGQERRITVDSLYISNSVYNPNDDVVKGFSKGLMISYKSTISDSQLNEIIGYLKLIGKK